ncbi:MAG: PAS domain S-box protein, partial [Verrucomicrobia bacterium]|nr:PAS domain S-box protein [Verrucomicrobiota bacterium]
MTLRTKTLLTSAALLVVTLAVFAALSARLLLRGFIDVESDKVRQNAQRLREALEGMLDQLDITTRDWAWWDDTYDFVVTTNADYVCGTLNSESLANIGINLIAFLDPSGRLVYGSALDRENMTQSALPEDLVTHLKPGRTLLRFTDPQGSVKGILLLPSEPALVAVRQILTSQQEGPPRGTLLMARFLDQDVVEQLQQRIGLPVCICRLDEDNLCTACARAAGLTKEPGGIVVQAESKDRISGYIPLNDLYGKPALVARVDQHRTIYAHARRTLWSFLAVLSGIGLACFASAVVLSEKLVISRLDRLDKDVVHLRGGFSPRRVAASGNDEVAGVARSINAMIEALDKAHADQLRIESQYHGMVETMPDVVYSLNRDGLITSLNPAFEKLTGWSSDEWLGRPFPGLVHPNDLPRAIETFQEVLRGKRPAVYELSIRTKAGDWRVGEFSSSPWIEGGEVVGEFGIARDITERQQAEAEIRELLARSDKERLALLSVLEDVKRAEEGLRKSKEAY